MADVHGVARYGRAHPLESGVSLHLWRCPPYAGGESARSAIRAPSSARERIPSLTRERLASHRLGTDERDLGDLAVGQPAGGELRDSLFGAGELVKVRGVLIVNGRRKYHVVPQMSLGGVTGMTLVTARSLGRGSVLGRVRGRACWRVPGTSAVCAASRPGSPGRGGS